MLAVPQTTTWRRPVYADRHYDGMGHLVSIKPGYNCTTVNIDIHYVKPAQKDVFLCSAWCTHKTGHSCFVRGDIHDAEGDLVVMGQGTFRIVPLDLLK